MIRHTQLGDRAPHHLARSVCVRGDRIADVHRSKLPARRVIVQMIVGDAHGSNAYDMAATAAASCFAGWVAVRGTRVQAA